jgi:hypothetical protein
LLALSRSGVAFLTFSLLGWMAIILVAPGKHQPEDRTEDELKVLNFQIRDKNGLENINNSLDK